MPVELVAVVVGGWLFHQACNRGLSQLVAWKKGDDRERAQRKKVAVAVHTALEATRATILADGRCAPSGVLDLFADLLELAATAAAGQSVQASQEPRLRVDLTPEQGKGYLACLGRLFAEAACDEATVNDAAATVEEYARVHAGRGLAQADRDAIRLIAATFLAALARELRQVLPKHMGLAAVRELDATVAGAATRLEDRLASLSERVSLLGELVAGRRLLPPASTRAELAPHLEAHRRAESATLQAGLQARIERLLAEFTGDGQLPPVDRLYVRAEIAPAAVGRGDRPPDDASRRGRRPGLEDQGSVAGSAPPALARFLAHRLITLTGAPGSGKSTELRRLGQHLLAGAGGGGSGAVPVYLSLPLLGDQPVLDALVARFDACPALLSSVLVGAHGLGLVVLLDGLDEVERGLGRRAAEAARDLVARHDGASVVLAGRAQAETGCWGVLSGTDRLALALEPLDQGRQLARAPSDAALLQGLSGSEPGRRWRVAGHRCGDAAGAGRRRLVQAVTMGVAGAAESWLLVPAGPLIAGDVVHDSERPVRVESLDRAVWVARDPVRLAEYRCFVGEGYDVDNDDAWAPFRNAADAALGGRRQPASWEEQKAYPDRPVVGVTWFEAAAYCRWLAEQQGASIRLPGEAEWEKAARGLLGRRWPWGCAWRDGLARVGREWSLDNPAPCTVEASASPFGLRGMAGNVWEWTMTRWQEHTFAGRLKAVGDVRGDPLFVLRGGSFVDAPSDSRCACRYGFGAVVRSVDSGFRCARDVSDTP